MSWRHVAQWELRRRAVIGGRVLDAVGGPAHIPVRLSIEPATAGGRRHDAQLRPGGVFFFLDVPAGRHTLQLHDAEGTVLQTAAVTVPPAEPGARLPLVTVELRVGAPTRASGRPHRRSRTS